MADLDALDALERHFPGDRIRRAQLRHLVTEAHATVLVATIDEGEEGAEPIVGDAIVAYRRGSPVARLYSLVVDPLVRGRGAGGALLAAAEDDARRHGARVVALEVREDNEVARSLYARRGYEPVGRVPGYYHDGCTAVRMRKPLPPAGADGPEP